MTKLASFILCFLCVAAPASAQPPKLKRAMVLSGQNLNTAFFVGLLDGAIAGGWTPEILVTSCGASIAAAVVQAIPDQVQRRAFIQSQEFYEVLKAAEFNPANGPHALNRILELQLRETAGVDVIPPIFDSGSNIMFVPERLPAPRFNRPFSSSGIRALMVGTRTAFHSSDVGEKREGRKLYEEVLYTDPATAEILTDEVTKKSTFQAPASRMFPESPIQSETTLITDATVAHAARVSISDPYLMNPVLSGGTYYIGGFSDLYPLELAHAVADEVMMHYVAPFDYVQNLVTYNIFRFDMNERIRFVNRQGVSAGPSDYWMDVSDFEPFALEHGFTPKIVVQSGPGLEFRDLVRYLVGASFAFAQDGINRLHVENSLPSDFNEFTRRTNALWTFGYIRGFEGVMSKKLGVPTPIRNRVGGGNF